MDELEKASESTNHENGRLRAQVERLNTEVKEYRKRLSMTAPGLGRSPPTASPVPYTGYNNSNNPSNNQSNDFVFAFPKFGDLPGSHFMNNGFLAKASPPAVQNSATSRNSPSAVPSLVRASSSQQSPTTNSPISPNDISSMRPNSLDQYQSPSTSFGANNLEELNGLFDPSILENAKRSNSADYMFPTHPTLTYSGSLKSSSIDNYRGSAKPPGFNQALSNGSTSSPSASSMSHAGQDSSCGTTPEPCADSPEHRKISEASLNTINEETAHANNQFQGEKSPQRAVQIRHPSRSPILQKTDEANLTLVPPNGLKSPVNDSNGIDWLAQQNGGQFDPVLFGDYRDSQENIMNTNFGDFFNDAFLTQDFTTPFNTGEITTAPQPVPQQTASLKSNPIIQCDAAQAANDEPVATGVKPKQYIGCDKLWYVLIPQPTIY